MNPLLKAIAFGMARICVGGIAGFLAAHGCFKADSFSKEQLAEVSSALAMFALANWRSYVNKVEVNSLILAAWAMSPREAWLEVKRRAKAIREGSHAAPKPEGD